MRYGKAQHPVVVKRYAGSRLYHPDRCVYLTREDLISMALRGEPFRVVDASTRENVTSAFRPIIAEHRSMAKSEEPVVIKRYANRRFYNTGTNCYVTLEELAGMVTRGEDFVVHDGKTGEDVTRAVLTQISPDQ